MNNSQSVSCSAAIGAIVDIPYIIDDNFLFLETTQRTKHKIIIEKNVNGNDLMGSGPARPKTLQ